MLNKNSQPHEGGMPMLCIQIKDSSPEARKDWIVSAITNCLRWYATTPDKRPDDDEHAVVLIDLLSVVQAIK